MSIQVVCDCAMTYRLPDRFSGKRCRCRECGDSIRVPRVALETSDAVGEPASAKSAASAKKLKSSDSALAASGAARSRVLSDAKARRAARVSREPSESLHQMAPLNLSESRLVEPPVARKRVKAHQAEVAAASAQAKRAAHDLEESRTLKKGKKKAAKNGKARGGEKSANAPAKKKKGRRDDGSAKTDGKRAKRRSADADDSDEEGSDARDRRAESGKKGSKARRAKAGKVARGDEKTDRKRRPSQSDDDGDEEAPRSKLSPRQQKRRQQLLILGGSLGGALLCIAFLVGAISYRAHMDEVIVQRLAEAKTRVEKARSAAKAQDWDNADRLYKETIAFVDDDAHPVTDDAFLGEFKRFRGQKLFFEKILAARRRLVTDPTGAVDDFAYLVGADDEIIRQAGIEGLVETGDGRIVDLLVRSANDGAEGVRTAARRGLIKLGTQQAIPFLAPTIRENGMATPLGKAAVEKALEGSNPEPESLLAILDKISEPDVLCRALKLLGSLGDPRTKGPVEKRTAHADAQVAKAAADALAQIKGEKP